MIKETNTRIIITVSKNQDIWLTKQAKKLKITKSKLIAWLISIKAREMLEITKLKDYELDELIAIAKTEWLK